ncbi:hypothetical protein BJV74DRAFT_300582 [Russula compacta]|nr:hypothetical protein BJV74DRAFT_300582 [Russula compacta]
MVDFNDPFVIAQDILTVSKVWHAVGALYVWEFVTTFDYEWAVIRGTRPYRWTIWIYSFTRVSTLLAVILSLVGFNDLAPFNCEVEVLFEFLFGYLAMASASLLIVLRVIAIWNWKKVIIAIAAGAWVTNLSFLIHNIAQIRAIWVPAGIHLGCTVLNIQSTKLNIIVTLCTDIILLIVLFTALLRHRLYKRESSSLGHLLWKQGLIWLLIATVAEVPPAVFICLNLNGRHLFV